MIRPTHSWLRRWGLARARPQPPGARPQPPSCRAWQEQRLIGTTVIIVPYRRRPTCLTRVTYTFDGQWRDTRIGDAHAFNCRCTQPDFGRARTDSRSGREPRRPRDRDASRNAWASGRSTARTKSENQSINAETQRRRGSQSDPYSLRSSAPLRLCVEVVSWEKIRRFAGGIPR